MIPAAPRLSETSGNNPVISDRATSAMSIPRAVNHFVFTFRRRASLHPSNPSRNIVVVTPVAAVSTMYLIDIYNLLSSRGEDEDMCQFPANVMVLHAGEELSTNLREVSQCPVYV